jgi:hypothetical protein
MTKCLSVWCALALTIIAAGCTKSSPARPSNSSEAESGASVSDAATGVTMTSPQLVTPIPAMRYKFSDQQLTLTVKNAVTTGQTALTYGFQVANDAAFASIAYAKDGVAEGTNGQTALKIDKLAGNKDYYWRVRASSGGLTGPYTPGRLFNVGPEVIIQAPNLVLPANGGTLNGNGSLIIANAGRTGPAGTIQYRFELSDSQSFNNLTFVATVAEQGGSSQTSVVMNTRLSNNVTYFWRVQASDPSNGVTGPYSGTFTFRYVPFDMSSAVIVNSPADLASWPETAKITSVNFTGGSFNVDFDKRDGGDRWPDVVPPGWAGALQYTLGMCVNITGTWYCSGVVQFWHGRELEASAPPSEVGREWFYAPERWGPMLGYQPSDGESVALWVAAGNLRDGGNFSRATCPRVCERSNAVLVPWSNGGAASYVFSQMQRIAKGQ